jgi:exonuclease III
MKTNKSLVSSLLLSFILFAGCHRYSPPFLNKKIENNYPELNFNFATKSSFDIMTWNLENFPKNEFTLNYVARTINALDMDVIALQEIKYNKSFEELLIMLPQYEGCRVKFSKHKKRLAFIYKKEIGVKDIYQIYKFRHFPFENPYSRSPFVLELEWNSIPLVIINNHFPNGSKNYKRRLCASNLLKSYVDKHFKDRNVIILGDFNDNLTESLEVNVFQKFLADKNNYLFTDMNIAKTDSTNWSFPRLHSNTKNSNHIDHILISNELFDEFKDSKSEVIVIKLEDQLKNYWPDYHKNISDHRPVGLKLYF